MIPISYRHVRCFLEVARLSSVGQAAEALAISQPAVSKTLRELEERLGTALFERAGRRLRLTTAGRLFQKHAGLSLAELDRGVRALAGAGGGRRAGGRACCRRWRRGCCRRRRSPSRGRCRARACAPPPGRTGFLLVAAPRRQPRPRGRAARGAGRDGRARLRAALLRGGGGGGARRASAAGGAGGQPRRLAADPAAAGRDHPAGGGAAFPQHRPRAAAAAGRDGVARPRARAGAGLGRGLVHLARAWSPRSSPPGRWWRSTSAAWPRRGRSA